MFKKKFIKQISKIHFYHKYIELKNSIVNLPTSIIGKISIFCYLNFKLKSRKLNLFIVRDLFGESVYEYVNALSNINEYIKDYKNVNGIEQINIFIQGRVINNILDNWFHKNFHILIRDKLIRKEIVNPKKTNYFFLNHKKICITYVSKKILFQNYHYYCLSRVGNFGSYTNRFDLSSNYKLLKNTKKFLPIEDLSLSELDENFQQKLNKLFSKKIVVFYDYDIDNRKNRKNLSSFTNSLKEDLYLRYIDSSIVNDLILELTNEDYNVIRLGRSNNKYPIQNKNFYDLAFELRNKSNVQFLDFLIPSKALFCITLGSGAHECARVFGLPMFFVGYHRFDNLYQLSNSMVIPKKIYDKKDNSLIPSSKLKRMRLIPYDKLYWDSKGFYIQAPSSQELIQSFKEFKTYLKNIKDNHFINVEDEEIKSWQNFYCNENNQYKRLKKSEFGIKEKFSIIVSKYELHKFKDFYLK